MCVDDGSSDDSANEARLGGAVVVKHPINLGQGAALRTGLDYALRQKGADFFVTFDSDGQHSVDAYRLCEHASRSCSARGAAELAGDGRRGPAGAQYAPRHGYFGGRVCG